MWTCVTLVRYYLCGLKIWEVIFWWSCFGLLFTNETGQLHHSFKSNVFIIRGVLWGLNNGGLRLNSSFNCRVPPDLQIRGIYAKCLCVGSSQGDGFYLLSVDETSSQ